MKFILFTNFLSLPKQLLVNQPVDIEKSLIKSATVKQNKANSKVLGSIVNSINQKKSGAGLGLPKKMKSSISTTSAIDVTGFMASEHFPNAFTFDETAFQNFTRGNGYSHVIRSQNCLLPNGFDLRFANRCITVFSCSNYLQHCAKGEMAKKEPANLSSVVFIDGSSSRIRMISFDTNGQVVSSPAKDL